MPRRDARRVAAAFKARYKGLRRLKIEIHGTQEDIGRAPNPDNPGHYVLGRNTVRVFADYVGSAEELETLLRHEVFSHFAIDSLDPAARAELHGELVRALNSDPATRAFFNERVAPDYGDQKDADNAEELVARVAEANRRPSLPRRVIAQLKRIIRKCSPESRWELMTAMA